MPSYTYRRREQHTTCIPSNHITTTSNTGITDVRELPKSATLGIGYIVSLSGVLKNTGIVSFSTSKPENCELTIADLHISAPCQRGLHIATERLTHPWITPCRSPALSMALTVLARDLNRYHMNGSGSKSSSSSAFLFCPARTESPFCSRIIVYKSSCALYSKYNLYLHLGVPLQSECMEPIAVVAKPTWLGMSKHTNK
jgi:hypothetical protein